MYRIDFLTCTAADLIARSIVCHPSLFAEAILKAGSDHFGYARNAGPGQRGAMSAGRHCSEVVATLARNDMSDREKAEKIASAIGPRVQAVTIAARLQCASQFASEIVTRA